MTTAVPALHGGLAEAPSRAAGRLLRTCSYLLMFAMVVVPVTHNEIKLALVAVVLVGSVMAMLARGYIRLHPHVLLWFLFYVCLGGVFALKGYLTGAPGAAYVTAIYVLFPALYGILVEGASDLRLIKGLLAAAIIGCIATSAYMLYYALFTAGFVPSSLFFRLDENQGIAFLNGFVQTRLYSISGLVFLVPFVAAALAVYTDPTALRLGRRWLWVALGFGLCGTFLSGRKALMLTVAATPLLIVSLAQFLEPRARARARALFARFAIGVALVLVAAAVYLPATGAFDWDRLLGFIRSGFDFQGDVGANERLQQLHGLFGGWTERPLFGWGWGHGARSIVRSGRPWEYELQYALLLFSTGIAGFLAYAAGTVWVYVMAIRVVRSGDAESQHLIPLLIGLTSALIANGSNPYLVSAGNMWMLFLPVAAINTWLINHRQSSGGTASVPRTVQGAAPDAAPAMHEREVTMKEGHQPALIHAPPNGAALPAGDVTVYRLLGAILESWRLVLTAMVVTMAVAAVVIVRQGESYSASMELTTVSSSKTPKLGGAVGALLDLGAGGIEVTPALVLRLMRTDVVLQEVARSPYPDSAHPLIQRVLAPEGRSARPDQYGEEIDRLLRTSTNRDAGTLGITVTHPDSAVARVVATRLLDATTRAFTRASRAQASQLRQAQEARVEAEAGRLREAERALVQFNASNRAVPGYSPLVIQRKQLERNLEVAQSVYLQVVKEHESAVGKELEETPALVVLDPVPPIFAPDRRHAALKLGLAALLGALIGAALGIGRHLVRDSGDATDRLYLRRTFGQLPLVGRLTSAR